MTSIKQINKAIKQLNINGELVRGNGYYYFIGELFDVVPSIYANNLRAYTTEEIIETIKDKLNINTQK